MKKGMIFAGCSFTWGQGLYYYSNMSTLKEPPPEQYDNKLVTSAHRRFMAAHRWPRLVANHFETFEIVKKENGGSEDESLKFIDVCFQDKHHMSHIIEERFYPEEIGYIILQTSQAGRSSFNFTQNGYNYKMNWIGSDPNLQKIFFAWMKDNNIGGFPEWYVEHCKQQVLRIKEAFMKYEEMGIKCLIWNWQDDYVKYVEQDPYLQERMIYFDYEGERFTNLDYIQRIHRHLLIRYDNNNLGPNPPQDSHPSLECHKFIADAVIKKIESL